MTKEQINIAIAESLGWSIFHRNDKGEIKSWKHPDGSIWQEPWVPLRFTEDLNAMHEALKTLPPDQLWDVAYSLPMETMLGFMATARELAETFLMVIGKWKPTTEESSAADDWRKLMKGVRVEGNKVVIATKNNDAAREVCGALIEEMNK